MKVYTTDFYAFNERPSYFVFFFYRHRALTAVPLVRAVEAVHVRVAPVAGGHAFIAALALNVATDIAVIAAACTTQNKAV